MAATNETLDGLNEIHGQKKPDDMGLGEWVWGALQGDFNAERSTGQIGFDIVVSLIPVVDTLCDVRDLCANIRQYRQDPTNKITLFFIATTVVGFIPELGTVVKSVLRLAWVYMKPLVKHADDITNASKLTAAAHRACDSALPRISEYLQHNRVAKWATDGKLPNIYKFVAKAILHASDKADSAKLRLLLNNKLDDLRALLKRIRPIVPSTIREHLDELLTFVEANRASISRGIEEFTQPVRTVLKVVAKRLDDHAWKVQLLRNNQASIAPISASGAAQLINANPLKWAKKFKGTLLHPPMNANSRKVISLMKANPTHPRITKSTIETFASTRGGMRPDVIQGPAKLYRIVDRSSEAAGTYWVSEATFKALTSREQWRIELAVVPHWNGNGDAVMYQLGPDETLKVWRGPAASQVIPHTDRFLKGGGEQIVFFPGQRDEMVKAMPRIDRQTGAVLKDKDGNDDRRIEFSDATGETVPASLRVKINDPHISQPFSTGWGIADYSPEEAKRILLTAPSEKFTIT